MDILTHAGALVLGIAIGGGVMYKFYADVRAAALKVYKTRAALRDAIKNP